MMNHRVCTLIMSLSEPAYAISDFQKKNITVVEIELSSARKEVKPVKSTK